MTSIQTITGPRDLTDEEVAALPRTERAARGIGEFSWVNDGAYWGPVDEACVLVGYYTQVSRSGYETVIQVFEHQGHIYSRGQGGKSIWQCSTERWPAWCAVHAIPLLRHQP